MVRIGRRMREKQSVGRMNMPWEYSEKTTKLFLDAVHGRPGTHMGEIEPPDGLGEHGSIACGDALRFSFRVERHPTDPLQDVIVEARYLTFGCTSAIASSEALCALVEKGRYTPIEALKIRNRDIVEYLEGLPQQKIHCSVMGAEALEAAVFDWAGKRGVDLNALGVAPRAEEQEEGRTVCTCFGLSEPYIRRKVRELGLQTVQEITDAIKAGGACGSCREMPGGLVDILEEIWGAGAGAPADAREAVASTEGPTAGEASRLSPYRFGKRVEAVLNDTIRPMLQKDGGDVELVDIKDELVYCTLTGACAGCAGAAHTLKMMVEKTLKERVGEPLRVIEV